MSEKKYNEKEVKRLIDGILGTIESRYARGKMKDALIRYDVLIKMLRDLNDLFNIYADINVRECGRLVITRYIKTLNLVLAIDTNESRLIEYHNMLENAYKLAGRVSLEHFIIYYEWYEDDKLYEKRESILKAYVYYLNKMCYDENFTGIIANLPSGYREIQNTKAI